MKRITQIIGVLVGLGALLWAMRDRIVAIATSREPQLPAVQQAPRIQTTSGTAPAASEVADVPPTPSVTDVNGIGPVYATRLEAGGITTLEDLAASAAEKVAEIADVGVSRAEEWVRSAKELAGD